MRNFEDNTCEFNNDGLSKDNDKPDNKEHWICEYTIENVFLIINLSGIKHVKYLHNDEYIENISHMSTWSPFNYFGKIKLTSIPVVVSSRVDLSSIVLVFDFRFRIEFFSSKNNNVDNNDLIDGHSKDMLYHLS